MQVRALAVATTVAALTAVSGAAVTPELEELKKVDAPLPATAHSQTAAAAAVATAKTAKAAPTATTMAAEPTIEEIRIPNRTLNNVSKALDYVSGRLSLLTLQTNSMMGNNMEPISTERAQQVVNMVRMPLPALKGVLNAATAIAKASGLKLTTPVDLTEGTWGPTCDGLCLLGKANKIVTDGTTFGNLVANRTGLEKVAELIKPVIGAASALVVQLDGDLPDATPTAAIDAATEAEVVETAVAAAMATPAFP